MAKKNSSKTATEKSIQASEPRVMVYGGWQGVNFKDAPLGWEPLETGHYDHREADLKPNFLMVQNNLVTCDTLTVQTRPDSVVIGKVPSSHPNAKFTGVSCLFHRWLFCVIREPYGQNSFKEYVAYRDIKTNTLTNWTIVSLFDAELNSEPDGYEIREIGYYEGNLIATTIHKGDANPKVYEGEIFTARLEYKQTLTTTNHGIVLSGDSLSVLDELDNNYHRLRSVRKVSEPQTTATIEAMGELHGNSTGEDIPGEDDETYLITTRIDLCYCYVNKYGSTLPSPITTYYTDSDPVTWSGNRYIKISGHMPNNLPANHGITGIDVYCSIDNKQTKAFIAHINFDTPPASGQAWSTTWLGAMSDITNWSSVQLELPEENTTKGVTASHFGIHDSRLYFWGDPNNPYRLYVGGNAGSELSIARGLGGAFVDIEPGTGIEIMGTAKWKTVQGANIITMMCGNPNTNMVKRFNLVETNTSISNEISSKGYIAEEVSNVQGCNSRWGYGVFSDGLYSINRYGLMLTTMAMEYNSQMRSASQSDVIQPIFTDRLGKRLKDARLVCIDEVIYIVLSEDNSSSQPTNLDQVILCYDIGKKAWYTFTHDFNPTARGELILHAMAIDSDEYTEGLGLITESEVRLYPTTGIQGETKPTFNVLMETGELALKQPIQGFHYVSQVELRFDYFIGSAECLIEGVDYYGRPFKVWKKLNRSGREGNFRSYTEWIRVDKYVESYRLRIIGKARFRLISINSKVYTQSNRIGLAYGFDDHDWYKNRRSGDTEIHHYIDDYNNLRRAIVT